MPEQNHLLMEIKENQDEFKKSLEDFKAEFIAFKDESNKKHAETDARMAAQKSETDTRMSAHEKATKPAIEVADDIAKMKLWLKWIGCIVAVKLIEEITRIYSQGWFHQR